MSALDFLDDDELLALAYASNSALEATLPAPREHWRKVAGVLKKNPKPNAMEQETKSSSSKFKMLMEMFQAQCGEGDKNKFRAFTP